MEVDFKPTPEPRPSPHSHGPQPEEEGGCLDKRIAKVQIQELGGLDIDEDREAWDIAVPPAGRSAGHLGHGNRGESEKRNREGPATRWEVWGA